MSRVHQCIEIERSLSRVFDFHKNPHNLGQISPGKVRVKVRHADLPMCDGAEIRVSFYFGPFPLPWVSVVEDFKDGKGFTEVQTKGPFSLWRHQHLFEETKTGTRLTEIVDYEFPLGSLGVKAAKLFMGGMSLDEIFQQRQENTKRLLERQAFAGQEVW